MSVNFDVFVIGAGVAGLAAARDAATRGLKVAIAEKDMFGGLILNVNHLKPAPPGLPSSGSDLSAGLMESISELGVETIFEPVESLQIGQDGQVGITTQGGAHTAKSVVVAAGARLKKLGVPGEAEFEHRGVSHCADCDAPIYRDSDVVIVGGGDSALQEAQVLAEFCSTVHLIHRGASFSARRDFIEAVQSTPRIKVYFESAVEALEGQDALSAVKVRNLKSGDVAVLSCKGFFAYVGLEPNAEFLPAELRREQGLIKVDDRLETSCKNIFAIGAVRSGYDGQLTRALEDARSAVDAVCERLATKSR